MKILQLVTRRQRRGAEVFAAQLSDGLVQEGHDVLLVGLCTPPTDPLVPLLAPVRDLGGESDRRLDYSLISQLVQLTRDFAPDLVQGNGSATLKYASLARALSRAHWPLVYRNISIASQWLRGPAHRLWVQMLVRNVSHVAAVSRLSADDFRSTYRLPPDRVSTIPIGVHVPQQPKLPALRQHLASGVRVPEGADLLLHVGSFTPEKNHAWLVDVFARILEKRPGAHLVLVGEGPLESIVESQVADRGLQKRVHFLGTRGDVPTLIGGADLLLLPSTIEGIPGVVLEAAAQAVPTVATNVGSLNEAVDDGKSGVLVEPGNKDAFSNAVCQLLGTPALRREMGHAAYRLVKERYAMEGIVTRFQTLYQVLCNRPPVAQPRTESPRVWS